MFYGDRLRRFTVEPVSQHLKRPRFTFCCFGKQFLGCIAQSIAIVLSDCSTQCAHELLPIAPVSITFTKWHNSRG